MKDTEARITEWRKRANDYDPDAFIPRSQLARDSHRPECAPHGICFCGLIEIVESIRPTPGIP